MNATAKYLQRILTPGEHRCIDGVREGLTNDEIGAKLGISPRTVKTQLYRSYKKLGVKSRAKVIVQLGAK